MFFIVAAFGIAFLVAIPASLRIGYRVGYGRATNSIWVETEPIVRQLAIRARILREPTQPLRIIGLSGHPLARLIQRGWRSFRGYRSRHSISIRRPWHVARVTLRSLVVLDSAIALMLLVAVMYKAPAQAISSLMFAFYP